MSTLYAHCLSDGWRLATFANGACDTQYALDRRTTWQDLNQLAVDLHRFGLGLEASEPDDETVLVTVANPHLSREADANGRGLVEVES